LWVLEMNELIRVLIFSSNQTARENLRDLLCGEKGMTVIGVASNDAKALAETRKLSPDIILIHTDNGMTSFDIVRAINKAQLPTKVVIITENISQSLVPAIKAGATALLPGSIIANELAPALRRIYLWCSTSSALGDAGNPNTTLFEI
jgi:DNA-binding NarL/FixJ family response regulator